MSATADTHTWKAAMCRELLRHKGEIRPAGYAAAVEVLDDMLDADDPLEVSDLSDELLAKLEQERAWAETTYP